MSKATDILEVGLALANVAARASIAYQAWAEIAATAKADGRTDFTQAELDAIHGKMQEVTDRFLSRDFSGGDPP